MQAYPTHHQLPLNLSSSPPEMRKWHSLKRTPPIQFLKPNSRKTIALFAACTACILFYSLLSVNNVRVIVENQGYLALKNSKSKNQEKRQLHRPPVHVLTFADSKYEGSRRRIIYEAQQFYNFSSVSALSDKDLPDNLLAKHGIENFSNFVNEHPRGYGYWVWKPALALEKMHQLIDGEILLYVDAGCSFNTLGIERFYEYLDLVEISKGGLLVFQLPLKEHIWTKNDTLVLLDCVKENCYDSGQIIATVWMMKKNPANLSLLQSWLAFMLLNDSHFVTDAPSSTKHPNSKAFKEHRHDQSIFSLLVKKRYREHGNVLILPDDTYVSFNGEFSSENAKNFPIWARRQKEKTWKEPPHF